MAIAAASPSQKTGAAAAGPASSVALTFPNNVTAGSLLTFVVTASVGTTSDAPVAADLTKTSGTATIGTVSLDLVDTRLIGGVYYLHAAIYSVLVTGSGSLTMTYANVANATYFIAGDEYTGSWDSTRVEDTASAQATSTAPSSGDATSAGAALFIGAQGMATGALAGMTPDAAFTQIAENEGSSTQVQGSAISRIVSSGTTDAASWTNDVNQEWLALVVAYKEASAPTTTITPGSGSIVVAAKQPGVYVNPSLRPIYVGSTTAVLSNSTTGSYNVSLTGLTGGVDTQPRTGDLVIVGTGWTGVANGTPGVTTPNDFTEVGFTGGGWADDTRDANLWVGYKKQGSTPDTSLTVTAGGSAAYGNATVVHVWRGVDWLSPMDVTVPAGATLINASRPNPPSITPSTAGAVVVTVGGATGATSQTAMTPPSAYGNTRTAIGDGSTGDFEAMIASWNRWTSGAHDAAAWTGGTTSTSDSACAVSLALRPGLYIEPPPQDQLVLLGYAPSVQQNSAASPTVTPNSSSIVLAGAAPSIALGLIRPPAGAIVLTGAVPVQTYTLPAPAAAAIVLTGYAPTRTVGSPTVTITPAAASVVIGGTAPSLSLTVRPAAGALALSSAAPTLAGQVSVPAGVLTLTGAAPTALVSLRVQPPDASLVLAGAAPSIQAGNSFAITPPAGAVTLSGTAPALAYSWLVRPSSGALAVAGAAPSAQVTSASTLIPNAASVVLTGAAPGVGAMIRPAAGAAVLAGAAPTVIVPRTITPAAGAVVLAGAAPTVLRTLTVTVPDATVLLAGAAPTASVTTLAFRFPDPAALALSGAAPTATLSEMRTVVPPAAAVLLSAAVPIIVVGTVSLPRSRRLGRKVAEPTMAEAGLAYSAGRVGPTVLRKRTGVLA